MSTPRPWPENTIPTAEQLADWLGICTPEERLEVTLSWSYNRETASRCIQQNHDGQLEAHRQRFLREQQQAEQERSTFQPIHGATSILQVQGPLTDEQAAEIKARWKGIPVRLEILDDLGPIGLRCLGCGRQAEVDQGTPLTDELSTALLHPDEESRAACPILKAARDSESLSLGGEPCC